MIPLRDSITAERTPLVNYAMIAICSVVFFSQVTAEDGGKAIIESFALVPLRLAEPEAEVTLTFEQPVRTSRGIEMVRQSETLASPLIPPWLTVLTCMFLHGGWMHFIGNMWFLYIFGDNVEDRFGHLGYFVMYLGTGIAAGLAHAVTDWGSPIPTIGASGAIAGVMGAYALLYPHARVLAVLPIFIVLHTFVLPAPVFLGIWFAWQIFSGMSSSGLTSGVAWWAHIGGFVAGAGVALIVRVTGLVHGTPQRQRSHRF